MLYDVYKLNPGIYRYVGPYEHDDVRAHELREASNSYVTTVNNEASATEAAADDHAESRTAGGMVSRVISVDEAFAQFLPSRKTGVS